MNFHRILGYSLALTTNLIFNSLGQAAGSSGFGFLSAGLGAPLVEVKDRKPGDVIPESSGVDEIDALIREAEMKQSKIEQELLDLAWGDDD